MQLSCLAREHNPRACSIVFQFFFSLSRGWTRKPRFQFINFRAVPAQKSLAKNFTFWIPCGRIQLSQTARKCVWALL